jgi:ACT domain-containing protein
VKLNVILDAMGKWYDVNIDYSKIDILSQGNFTIKVDRSDNISNILEVLDNVAGIKHRIIGRTIYLYNN